MDLFEFAISFLGNELVVVALMALFLIEIILRKLRLDGTRQKLR
jgi:hypothetical protein